MCETPFLIRNKQFRESESGLIYKYHKVPCGRCFKCVKARKKGWTFRLIEEAKQSSSQSFITLTYDNDNIPMYRGVPTLKKVHYQSFMKRLRENTPPGLKYYAVGEYGDETQRPHYHAIMYNLPPEWTVPQFQNDILTKIWKKGRVQTDVATPQTMAYVAGYVTKKMNETVEIYDQNTGECFEREKEFSLMSKKLGIGFKTKQMEKYLKEQKQGFVMVDGYKQTLPRYFKEKIFSSQERVDLAKEAELYRDEKLDILDENQVILEGQRKKIAIMYNKKTQEKRLRL